ncbi:MAG TPA: prolipoprotein diacylglyceryl transferase [Candidatus Dormibacteraeota bacterium]|nr:prolipoprotein diacylglyceryl transferase [Candidatus Dormibacteraeota bacterium]
MIHALPAVININIDPVVHIGGLSIHWYGVGYAVAFWAAWKFGASPELRRHGMSQPAIDRLTTWCIVVGLIGARLYYDVQNTDRIHSAVDVIAVWNGGMAFFGAIISVFALLAVFAWRDRVSYWLLVDACALFAVVGQPIGRIGNIINGDILGDPSSLPWATSYSNPNAVLQSGFSYCNPPAPCVAYQPAGAYEMLATILIGVILFAMRHRVRMGVMAISYVALYSISQIIVFFWRASEPTVLWHLKQAQVTAIVILAVVVPMLIVLRRRFPPSAAAVTGTDGTAVAGVVTREAPA